MHANNFHNIPDRTPSTEPSFTVEEATGGALRVVANTAAQQAQQGNPLQSQPEPTRVHGGTLRHTAGGDAVESAAVARHVVTHEGTRGGSVMATVRQDGPARTVELVPGEPSSRTTIAVALREGVIKEVQPGLYADVAGAPQQAEQALQGPQEATSEAPAEDPAQAIFSAADSELFAEAVEPLRQDSFDAAVAGSMLAAALGGTLDDVATTLARSEGLDLQQARALVEQGAALHESALARALTARGITGERKDLFYAHCRERPGQLQEALQQLVYRRDPAGFLALAGPFVKANPGDLSKWHSAGFETHVTDEGELLVSQRGKGNWMSPAKLARS